MRRLNGKGPTSDKSTAKRNILPGFFKTVTWHACIEYQFQVTPSQTLLKNMHHINMRHKSFYYSTNNGWSPTSISDQYKYERQELRKRCSNYNPLIPLIRTTCVIEQRLVQTQILLTDYLLLEIHIFSLFWISTVATYELHRVSNHWHFDCFFHSLFRLTTM